MSNNLSRLFLGLFALMNAAACDAAERSGKKLAKALLAASVSHLGVGKFSCRAERPTNPLPPLQTQASCDFPAGGRFATYYVSAEGTLLEFDVNQPDARPSYAPIRDRQAFLRRLMSIAAPETSEHERAWAARELDSRWTPNIHPFPVQVGDFVFGGLRTGWHDHLWVRRAGPNVVGQKYRAKTL